MDAFRGNPPPDLSLFPADWYAQVLVRARRGPDAALAVAVALEEAFETSVPGPKEVEARRLIAWLKTVDLSADPPDQLDRCGLPSTSGS